jgi:hypothetical protein
MWASPERFVRDLLGLWGGYWAGWSVTEVKTHATKKEGQGQYGCAAVVTGEAALTSIGISRNVCLKGVPHHGSS